MRFDINKKSSTRCKLSISHTDIIDLVRRDFESSLAKEPGSRPPPWNANIVIIFADGSKCTIDQSSKINISIEWNE